MERLVELAKEGNSQAQNALYCRYKNRSLAVCRRITHDNELYSVVDATIKGRHLFARYSIVFPSFSVSEREKRGKHIGKR